MSHLLSDEDAKTYLDLGMTFREVPLLRYPDLTQDECDYVLWERTPFPLVEGIHDLVDALVDLEPPARPTTPEEAAR